MPHYFPASPGLLEGDEHSAQGRFIEFHCADPPRVAIDEARQYWPEMRRPSLFDKPIFCSTKLFGDVGSKFVEASAYTVVGIVGSKAERSRRDRKLGRLLAPYRFGQIQMVIPRRSLLVMALTVEKLIRQLDPELPINAQAKKPASTTTSSLVGHRRFLLSCSRGGLYC
jgi:hypothetical protein